MNQFRAIILYPVVIYIYNCIYRYVCVCVCSCAWINNYIHYKVLDEITDQFPNFNGETVVIWDWISNIIPHFIVRVIIFHAEIKVDPKMSFRPSIPRQSWTSSQYLYCWCYLGLAICVKTYLIQRDVLNSWLSSLSNNRIKELGVVIGQAGCSSQHNAA